MRAALKTGLTIALSAAALGTAMPALAQIDNAAPAGINIRTEESGGNIIVTGDPELEEQRVRDALRDITMRGRTTSRALPRFQEPVCPQVIGLGEQLGADVSARIALNTRLIGHEVGEEGCTPNAIVIIVDDPKGLVERMRKERWGLLDARALRRIKAGLAADDPALSWSTSVIRDRRGNEAENGGVLAGLDGLNSRIAGDLLFRNDNRAALRTELANSIERTNAVIVFDAFRLDNVHLGQLAGYATMRLLGDLQPAAQLAPDEPDTILNLFSMDPLDAAPGLTLMDLAYLRGLYAMEPRAPGVRLESFVLAAYEDLRDGNCDAGEEVCIRALSRAR